MCKRGDIYYVDFGQEIDTNKQKGVRPAVIVSNNKANEHSPVITVVPMTSKIYKKRFLPTHVLVPPSYGSGLERTSLALVENVDSIDKKDLREKKGNINGTSVMRNIDRALQIQLGVDVG